MKSIFKTVFSNKKSSTLKSLDETPALKSCNSAPAKKSLAPLKKFSIKFNGSLSFRIELPKAGSEFNCGWLVQEAKRKFEELGATGKYRNEIKRIIGLRSAEGFLPIDYWLSVPENSLDALPDKLTLQTMLSPEDDPNSSIQKVSLQDYELCGCLGRGAFANVYLARKKQNGKFYAIKQLKKGSLRQKEIDRLVEERDILRKCRDIGSVRLFCTFQTDEYCYFVMQYCAGGDIRRLIHEMGGFTEKEAKYYIKTVLEGVKNLHSKGILYRDLKAENLLLDLSGNVYLADFGLSKSIDDPDLNRAICGTPEFYAPEILRNEGYSFAVDYYNIGTLAYELVTMDSPFKTRKDLNTLLNDILTKEVEIPKTFSPNFQDFLRRILDKNPKTRLGSKGFDEIACHPWLVDASSSSRIEPSYLLIQKLVKALDFDVDKGIMIDGKNWFRQNPKRKTNQIVGFSIQSLKDVDNKVQSQLVASKTALRVGKEKGENQPQELSLVIDSTLKEDDNESLSLQSLGGVPSISNNLNSIGQSCDLEGIENEGEIVSNLQLEQYIFQSRSNSKNKKREILKL